MYESDNCRFFDNVFMGNNYGMIIHTGSDNTIVRDNIFRNNLKYGIWIDGGSGSRICSNYIHDNPYGIYIQSSLNNHINYNRICGNTNYGVYSDCGVDAEFNWWGDASGPSGAGSGTGDAVSANVDYDPWLGAPLELSAVHHESLGAGTHTVDASAEADTKVILNTTGETDIYIAKYELQPFPDEPFPDEALGKWIDIHVSDPDNVTWPIYVEVGYSDAEVAAAGIDESTLGLYYYKPVDTFHRCSDTGVNMTENFIWAYVNKTEASGLTGKEFGAGGNPPPERVPALTLIGLLALIGILSVVLAVATMKKRKSK